MSMYFVFQVGLLKMLPYALSIYFLFVVYACFSSFDMTSLLSVAFQTRKNIFEILDDNGGLYFITERNQA